MNMCMLVLYISPSLLCSKFYLLYMLFSSTQKLPIMLNIMLTNINDATVQVSRLTVVSREAKKKQHACASSGPRDHYSEYLHGWQL